MYPLAAGLAWSWKLTDFTKCIKMVIVFGCLAGNRFACLKMMWLGVVDGLKGVRGKRIPFFDLKGNVFKAPRMRGSISWATYCQSLNAKVEGLLEPILRLVVDLVALTEVAYADGDVVLMMSGQW